MFASLLASALAAAPAVAGQPSATSISPVPAATKPPAPAASPTPPAVIETMDSDVVANADGTFVIVRAMTVRIDREEAVRGVSTLPISVSRSLQKFELVEAWTETPDHKKVMVSPDNVVTQAPPYAAQMQTQSDTELKIVNFPAVAVGGRIHIVTRITQTTPFFPNAYMFDMAPGHATKVVDGSVKLSVPKAMKLHFDMDGFSGGQPKKDGDRTVYQWRFSVPDFQLPQPGELANLDQSPRLIATSMENWAALAKAYQSRADDAEKPTIALKALADKITANAKDDGERVRLLSKWVALNIRYVNIVLGVGGFVPASAESVLLARYGDCKGHATILNALLAAKGIESTSVLINAGASFREPTVAGQVFNHMINYVPKLGIFIDTTDPFALFGDLPVADRGKFVVLTRSGETKRTPIAGPQPDTLTSETNLVVRADGGIDGTTRVRPTGSFTGSLRQLALVARNQDPSMLGANLMRKNGSPGTGSISVSNPDGPDNSILLDGTWHLDDAAATEGTSAIRVPYPMLLETIAGVAASAAQPAPKRPVMCGAIGLSEKTVLHFPDNLTVTAIPAATKVDTADISYVSDWKRDGQTVTVTRSYTSRYPGRICSPETIVAGMQAKRQIAKDVSAQIVYQAKAAS